MQRDAGEAKFGKFLELWVWLLRMWPLLGFLNCIIILELIGGLLCDNHL